MGASSQYNTLQSPAPGQFPKAFLIRSMHCHHRQRFGYWWVFRIGTSHHRFLPCLLQVLIHFSSCQRLKVLLTSATAWDTENPRSPLEVLGVPLQTHQGGKMTTTVLYMDFLYRTNIHSSFHTPGTILQATTLTR